MAASTIARGDDGFDSGEARNDEMAAAGLLRNAARVAASASSSKRAWSGFLAREGAPDVMRRGEALTSGDLFS